MICFRKQKTYIRVDGKSLPTFGCWITMTSNRVNRVQRSLIKSAFLSFFISVLFCFPARAQATDTVLMVLSSTAVPYQKAAASLTLSLADDHIKSVTVISEDIASKSYKLLEKQYSPNIWVAIGSRAAAQVNKLLPPSKPLVYCMVVDPQKAGIDPRRRQIAGVSIVKSIPEQFAIIKTAMPTLDSIAMLYRSSSQQSMQTLSDVKKQLPKNWTLEAVDIDSMKSQAAAIQELFGRKSDLIWTTADSSIYNRAIVKSLLLASLRHGTPVFGFSGSFVKAGALFGLDADPVTQGEFAASIVKGCLGLPTERPCLLASGVTLSVNLVVAKRLGITLSDKMLAKATIVSSP